MESRKTASGGGGGMSKKEKGLMDIDNNVVIAWGRGYK